MTPGIVDLGPLTVRGIARWFDRTTRAAIPALWMEFVPHTRTMQRVHNGVEYGVCFEYGGTSEESTFRYMPCVEVDPSMPCPEGMTTIEIPSGRYARFTFNGHISGFSSWVDEVDGFVMPASGLRRRNAPEFERYDERWDAHTGMGPVDFYIPIEA